MSDLKTVHKCTEDRTEELVQRSDSVICSKSVSSELQLVKRLRGGAGGVAKLQDLAVRLAHRILPTPFCINPGTPNPATGNCLFESAVFNINDRPELAQFGQITDTILDCRTLWVTQFQTQIPIFEAELDAFTEEQWDNIKKNGAWDQAIGDVMPFCIAFATKKRILILHTYEGAEVPLSIVEPERFGALRDVDIPICLAYSGSHYESMHPVGTNIRTSIELFDKTKLDRQCTFLTSTNVKSMLGPLTGAEKMKRSRLMKSQDVVPSPKRVMTPDEKKRKDAARKHLERQQTKTPEKTQKEAARKQLERQQNQTPEKTQKETAKRQIYRESNIDKYEIEKKRKARAREENTDKYETEKQRKAVQQARARQENTDKYEIERGGGNVR